MFDEPLSNLDAKLRAQMRVELALLHKRLGKTTVYVTHDQIEAMTLGDKIAVMKDGVVQQFGTPDDIYSKPVNTFVASFMGSPPMNLIPVTLAVNDGVLCAEFLVGSGGESTQRLARLPLSGFNLSDLENIPALGASVLLGLRPEHLSDASRTSGKGSRLIVPVELAESTGADTLVFTTLGAVRCVCRLHPSAVLGRGEVELVVDVKAAVLFDPKSLQAIAFAQ